LNLLTWQGPSGLGHKETGTFKAFVQNVSKATYGVDANTELELVFRFGEVSKFSNDINILGITRGRTKPETKFTCYRQV
jgi:hypothetical protein